eukprot:gene4120-8191_t
MSVAQNFRGIFAGWGESQIAAVRFHSSDKKHIVTLADTKSAWEGKKPNASTLDMSGQYLREEARRETKLNLLNSIPIVGCDLLSSVLYTASAVVTVGGKSGPIGLILVAAMLFLYRKVYQEVVSAIPNNGGVYNALLNTTTKRIAALAACLSILSYTATALVSSFESILYLKLLWPDIDIRGATIIVLGFFAGITSLGVKDSSAVSMFLFVSHVFMLTLLVVWGIAYGFTDNWRTFMENSNRSSYPEILDSAGTLLASNDAGYAIFYGFSAGLLGISGFESAANYVEEMDSCQTYVRTLDVMWVLSGFFNPMFGLISLVVLPLEDVYSVHGDLLAVLGEKVGGKDFGKFVAIVGFMVLCGAVLTSYVGINGLVRRLAQDKILPSILLRTNVRGSNHWIIFCFFILCSSLFIAIFNPEDPTAIGIFAGVYALAFLLVMLAFALACISLKIQRPVMPRLVVIPWWQLIICLLAVSAGIVGNILLAPIVLQWFFIYMAGFIFVVFAMFQQISIMKFLIWLIKLLSKTDEDRIRARDLEQRIIQAHHNQEFSTQPDKRPHTHLEDELKSISMKVNGMGNNNNNINMYQNNSQNQSNYHSSDSGNDNLTTLAALQEIAKADAIASSQIDQDTIINDNDNNVQISIDDLALHVNDHNDNNNIQNNQCEKEEQEYKKDFEASDNNNTNDIPISIDDLAMNANLLHNDHKTATATAATVINDQHHANTDTYVEVDSGLRRPSYSITSTTASENVSHTTITTTTTNPPFLSLSGPNREKFMGRSFGSPHSPSAIGNTSSDSNNNASSSTIRAPSRLSSSILEMMKGTSTSSPVRSGSAQMINDNSNNDNSNNNTIRAPTRLSSSIIDMIRAPTRNSSAPGDNIRLLRRLDSVSQLNPQLKDWLHATHSSPPSEYVSIIPPSQDNFQHTETKPVDENELTEIQKILEKPLLGSAMTYCLKSLNDIVSEPFVFLARSDDPLCLHEAIDYVKNNELTQNLVVVHFVDDRDIVESFHDMLSGMEINNENREESANRYLLRAFMVPHDSGSSGTGTGAGSTSSVSMANINAANDGSPNSFLLSRAWPQVPSEVSQLIVNVALLDAFYEYIKVSCLIVRGSRFCPESVRWLSRFLNVPLNSMLMGMPDTEFPFPINEFIGVRIVLKPSGSDARTKTRKRLIDVHAFTEEMKKKSREGVKITTTFNPQLLSNNLQHIL